VDVSVGDKVKLVFCFKQPESLQVFLLQFYANC